jgi:hypothetical protein
MDKFLSYDPETGILLWKVSVGSRALAGSEAGCLNKSSGYIQIRIHGRKYYAHRIAHLLMTGHWPDGNPEHENLIKTDNRWVNIQTLAPSQSENGGHRGLQRNNTSGLKGVRWVKGHWVNGRYVSRVHFRGKQIHLGYFDDLRLAGLHYDAAAKLAWGLRFSCLNFPSEESDHIVLSERVRCKLLAS